VIWACREKTCRFCNNKSRLRMVRLQEIEEDPKKTIREAIENDAEINELDLNMVHSRT